MTPTPQGAWLPVRIEAMTDADLNEVLAIEDASFPSPWPREIFQAELRDPHLARLFVARVAAGAQQGRVAGYTCTWLVTDELHITNVAVHPDFRRQHVGQQLLMGVLTQARDFGARQAILEVRASNRGAQHLYGRLGFAPVDVRKHYYTDNREDAIVMFLDDIAARFPAQSSAHSN
jgi:ribosomal-protein-alanine N-acetyltransferase